MEITNLNDVVIDRGQNLQQQLYQYIVDRIIRGEFKGGMKLPASRQLASDLTISRNTVIKTLEQLCDEGYIESRRGSGVFINTKMNDTSMHTSVHEWQSELPLPELSRYAKKLTGKRDLSGRTLPFSPGITAVDEFPMEIWQRLIRRHCDHSILCGYNGIQGYLPLREALAQYLACSRGVKCGVEQIIITQGA